MYLRSATTIVSNTGTGRSNAPALLQKSGPKTAARTFSASGLWHSVQAQAGAAGNTSRSGARYVVAFTAFGPAVYGAFGRKLLPGFHAGAVFWSATRAARA